MNTFQYKKKKVIYVESKEKYVHSHRSEQMYLQNNIPHL